MSHFVPAAMLVFMCLCLDCRAQAQQDDRQETAQTLLPRWLNLGVELRARTEVFSGGDGDAHDKLYLNRTRLNVKVEPTNWVRFVFQGQDARAYRLTAGPGTEEWGDTLDIRLGYVEVGHAEEGFAAKLGRQEISLGDERLLAADNDWDVFGQSFDAASLDWRRGHFHMQAFTGFRVEPSRRHPDPFDTASRVSGFTGEWTYGETGVVQPYLLWKRGGETIDLRGHPGHRDIITPGILMRGGLSRGFDYNVEMAVQRGHVADEPMQAWAGHWEIGWRPFGPGTPIRLDLEYNFASGDRDEHDGMHGTFDDMYPAGFNRYGMPDPFAWRNIHYPEAAFAVPVSGRWTVYGGLRAYWLANRRDALYRQGEDQIAHVRDATSGWVGNHFHASAAYLHSSRWRLAGGYARLRAGDYLRQASLPLGANSVYFLLVYSR